MRTLILLLTFLATFSVQAQEEAFQRKGKILVETGYNIIGGFGGGTGLSILSDGNQSLNAIGLDVGTFVSNRTALKFNFSSLSGSSTNVLQIGAGVKHYFADKLPLEFTTGYTNLGEGSILSGLKFGYAAKLADNILAEVKPGLIIEWEEPSATLDFSVGFVMLF